MTTTTYTAVETDIADGYAPPWELENDRGEWVSDLAPSGTDVNAIEAAVAEALGCPVSNVTATPQGANITGDASHRNRYVTAGEWAVVVTDA